MLKSAQNWTITYFVQVTEKKQPKTAKHTKLVFAEQEKAKLLDFFQSIYPISLL